MQIPPEEWENLVFRVCVCVCVCERYKVLIDCTPFIVIIKYWLHSLCYTIDSCSLLFYTE